MSSSYIYPIFHEIKTVQQLCQRLSIPDAFSHADVADLKRYRVFHIRKRKSGDRVITAPLNPIRQIQKTLYRFLYDAVVERNGIRSVAHGFIPGRSIKTNALQHVGNRIVFNIDLHDFFPTISMNRVAGLFRAAPFSAPTDVASWLSEVCTYAGCLPQGTPTSPFISNLICFKLDRQLQQLAKQNNCIYTRYADDITFSKRSGNMPESIAEMDVTNTYIAGAMLRGIIETNGFVINRDKVHLYRNTFRQTVTGLVVNSKLNVHRKFVREIRAMIYDCQKNGFDSAYKKHCGYYRRKDKNGPVPPIAQIIMGKLDFLKMVRGANDPVRKNLQGRFARIFSEYNKVIERETVELESKDFFICHASEDKNDFVRPFAEALRASGVSVWYDEFELTIGDSLQEMISKGLNASKYGIIVLSKNFFQKTWTKSELAAFFSKEHINKTKCVLPLWHNVTLPEVASFNAFLADRVAWNTSEPLNDLAHKFKQLL